ncbi:MAG: outer membrane lipoprotein-sorting protein [Bacteroidales bacterium]|nr:outer membrane lipoprotein-sorting protein [Bacteroidales bacterium]
MKNQALIVGGMLIIMSFLAMETRAQDAEAIVKKSDQKFRGESSKGKMRMMIERPNWTRTIEMKNWSLGTEYSMILITAPAKEKGQAFLKRQNEMWHWMPSIERMIKIPPSMMMQSWMGSDFTNDDLVQESSIVSDYHKKVTGSETVNGFECHKIKLSPKEDAAVVWGEIVIWISKKGYYQLKAEYFDDFGDLVQTMTASDIRTFDDRKLPAKMSITPADKSGHQTTLEFVEMEFNVDIKESFFSQQRMKRLR